MSMLSHQSGSIEKYTRYRAWGRTPATFRTSDRGVPTHSPTYDHPSSHTTSVIWLRTGKLLRSAREYEAGRATIPSIERRQSAKPPAWRRLKASFKGGMALAKGTFEIMLRGNSRASECLAKSRWAA